jgi:ribonuclease Z
MAGLRQFTAWHEENFKIFPVGEGYDWEINEFDFKKQGEVIYDENGVKIIHWPTIHVSDGASSYRLDWNGLSFCFTGDNRPNRLAIKYCKGVDMYVSEAYTEVLGIQAAALGVLPAVARWTYDNYHTSAYALGYMAEQIQPRIAVATHWEYDVQQANELVAEVREHYKGPFALGAPDRIVFNVRRDLIWWREGVTSGLAQYPRPQFTPMVAMPVPPNKVVDIQAQWLRDLEIPPEEYFPEGYHPELLLEWPMTEVITMPMPESMVDPKYKKKSKN